MQYLHYIYYFFLLLNILCLGKLMTFANLL